RMARRHAAGSHLPQTIAAAGGGSFAHRASGISRRRIVTTVAGSAPRRNRHARCLRRSAGGLGQGVDATGLSDSRKHGHDARTTAITATIMKRVAATLAIVILLAGAGAIGYVIARQITAPAPATAKAESSQRKVLYWYDPMKLQQHFDHP